MRLIRRCGQRKEEEGRAGSEIYTGPRCISTWEYSNMPCICALKSHTVFENFERRRTE